MAIGAKTPIVVVNSSLVGSYTPDETQAVLGHEVGHVLSEHTYYTTALVLLHQFMKGALPKSLLLGLPVRGMYYALLEWARAAEMSSDRAAALVMGDPLVPCHVLMRLAGGALPGMNFDAFLEQADAYEDEDDLFSRHARFWSELSLTHPVAVRRVKELNAWVRSGEFDRIMGGEYVRRGRRIPSVGGIRCGRDPLQGSVLWSSRAHGGRRPGSRQAAGRLAEALPGRRRHVLGRGVRHTLSRQRTGPTLRSLRGTDAWILGSDSFSIGRTSWGHELFF